MAEIAQQLHYRKSGVVTNIKLYNTSADVGSDHLCLRVGGATVFARLGGLNESEATDLRARKGGSTFTVLKSNRIDLPSGFISMFQNSCPSGWTRETSFDNKFIQGASTPGATGGNTTHTHTYTIPTTYTNYLSATKQVRSYASKDMPEFSHRHRYLSRESNSETGNTLPEYITVVFCRKD